MAEIVKASQLPLEALATTTATAQVRASHLPLETIATTTATKQVRASHLVVETLAENVVLDPRLKVSHIVTETLRRFIPLGVSHLPLETISTAGGGSTPGQLKASQLVVECLVRSTPPPPTSYARVSHVTVETLSLSPFPPDSPCVILPPPTGNEAPCTIIGPAEGGESPCAILGPPAPADAPCEILT